MTTPKKSKITLEAHTAKYLADAMLAAISKDDITPILCTTRIQAIDGAIVAIATDRYRAHRVFVDPVKTEKDVEFLMPREAVVWLSKNARTYSTRGYNAFKPLVDIEYTAPVEGIVSDTGRVAISVRRDENIDESVTYIGPSVKGNFPQVERLIDAAKSAEDSDHAVRLNLALLSRVRTLAPDERAPRVKLTASTDGRKEGPVYVAYVSKEKTFADAIIQPNTELD